MGVQCHPNLVDAIELEQGREGRELTAIIGLAVCDRAVAGVFECRGAQIVKDGLKPLLTLRAF